MCIRHEISANVKPSWRFGRATLTPSCPGQCATGAEYIKLARFAIKFLHPDREVEKSAVHIKAQTEYPVFWQKVGVYELPIMK